MNQPPMPPRTRPPAGRPDLRAVRAARFNDRVMAQVAAEATPTPARVLLRSLLRLRLGAVLATMATAWHLAFGRQSMVPVLVRAQAFVVMVLFTVAIGTGGTLAAAGAVRILEQPSQPRPDRPAVVAPSTLPSPALVTELAEPSSPDPSPEPSAAGETEQEPAAAKGTGQGQDGSGPDAGGGQGAGSGSDSGGTSGSGQQQSGSEQQGGSATKRTREQDASSSTQQDSKNERSGSGSGGAGDGSSSSKSSGSGSGKAAQATPKPTPKPKRSLQPASDSGSGRGS